MSQGNGRVLYKYISFKFATPVQLTGSHFSSRDISWSIEWSVADWTATVYDVFTTGMVLGSPDGQDSMCHSYNKLSIAPGLQHLCPYIPMEGDVSIVQLYCSTSLLLPLEMGRYMSSNWDSTDPGSRTSIYVPLGVGISGSIIFYIHINLSQGWSS